MLTGALMAMFWVIVALIGAMSALVFVHTMSKSS